MSAHGRRARQRGHLLMEAMVGGVVLLLAAGGLSSALVASSQSLSVALIDQQAEHAALERLEWLRAQPASAVAWDLGTTSGPVVGHPDWTWTIEVTQVLDNQVAGPVAGLVYKRAQVTLAYRGRQVQLETYRW